MNMSSCIIYFWLCMENTFHSLVFSSHSRYITFWHINGSLWSGSKLYVTILWLYQAIYFFNSLFLNWISGIIMFTPVDLKCFSSRNWMPLYSLTFAASNVSWQFFFQFSVEVTLLEVQMKLIAFTSRANDNKMVIWPW